MAEGQSLAMPIGYASSHVICYASLPDGARTEPHALRRCTAVAYPLVRRGQPKAAVAKLEVSLRNDDFVLLSASSRHPVCSLERHSCIYIKCSCDVFLELHRFVHHAAQRSPGATISIVEPPVTVTARKGKQNPTVSTISETFLTTSRRAGSIKDCGSTWLTCFRSLYVFRSFRAACGGSYAKPTTL